MREGDLPPRLRVHQPALEPLQLRRTVGEVVPLRGRVGDDRGERAGVEAEEFHQRRLRRAGQCGVAGRRVDDEVVALRRERSREAVVTGRHVPLLAHVLGSLVVRDLKIAARVRRALARTLAVVVVAESGEHRQIELGVRLLELGLPLRVGEAGDAREIEVVAKLEREVAAACGTDRCHRLAHRRLRRRAALRGLAGIAEGDEAHLGCRSRQGRRRGCRRRGDGLRNTAAAGGEQKGRSEQE